MVSEIGKHQIVVVDLEFNVAVLTRCLEDAGYEVFSSASGELALELIDDVRPDLGLLDVKMLGIDGVRALPALRWRPDGDQVPLIVVSALTSVADKIRIESLSVAPQSSRVTRASCA